MQQIYRRKPIPKCDFKKISKQLYIEIALRHSCSPVNMLHSCFWLTPESCNYFHKKFNLKYLTGLLTRFTKIKQFSDSEFFFKTKLL